MPLSEPDLRESLDRLRETCGADLLTCYFFNPFSELHWSFHRSGEFKYPYQLFGTITHFPHRDALSGSCTDGIVRMDDVQAKTEFVNPILNSDPFAVREEIVSLIRITLVGEGEGKDRVTVFLSFRKGHAPEDLDHAEIKAAEFVETHRQDLLARISVPSISPDNAWIARNSQQKLLRGLGELSDADKNRWLAEFWQPARDIILESVKPQHGHTVICQIYVFDRNGTLEVLAGNDNPSDRRSRQGISDYVARTAQTFCVKSIRNYQKVHKGEYCPRRLPEYCHCTSDTEAASELAVPVTIGRKVVGVINLESSEEDGYSDENKLLVANFASALAVGFQQYLHWSDFRRYSSFVASLIAESECLNVFRSGVKVTKDMGYARTGIWKIDTDGKGNGGWVEGSDIEQNSIRADGEGLTRWIINNRRPLLVADFQLYQDNYVYKIKIGTIDEETSNIRWQLAKGDLRPNPMLQEVVKGSVTGVLCDIGIPIMCDFGDGEGEHVVAVLWVKCFRHEVAILHEDYWMLALLCRRMAEVKARHVAVIQRASAVERAQFSRHFGDKRTNSILKLKASRPDFFKEVRRATQVIVVNMDIRSSTEFTQLCLDLDEGKEFSQFLNGYHEMARRELLEYDGVFDKSMGDGVMGMFNLFRDDLVPIAPTVEKTRAMLSAVVATWRVLMKFEKLRDRLHEKTRIGFRRTKLRLCAALVMDTTQSYIGNIGNENVTGFDYSVYGNAANCAGKLVDMARTQTLVDTIKSNDDLPIVVECSRPGEKDLRRMSKSEASVLIDSLDHSDEPLLLASARFDDVIVPHINIFDGYLVDYPDAISNSLRRILVIRKKPKVTLDDLGRLVESNIDSRPKDRNAQSLR